MEKAKDSAKDIVRAHTVVTIERDAHELYALWSDVEKAPLWQEGVQSVVSLGGKRSRWVMQGPFHTSLEWVSEIIEEEPGRRIAWETVKGDLQQRGEVVFVQAPGGRGTVVKLTQEFQLPGGKLANTVSSIVARSPRQIVVENLRHFKQLTEAGEIPTTEGQPTGPRSASGKVKEFVYGETNPAAPGTSRHSTTAVKGA